MGVQEVRVGKDQPWSSVCLNDVIPSLSRNYQFLQLSFKIKRMGESCDYRSDTFIASSPEIPRNDKGTVPSFFKAGPLC